MRNLAILNSYIYLWIPEHEIFITIIRIEFQISSSDSYNFGLNAICFDGFINSFEDVVQQTST